MAALPFRVSDPANDACPIISFCLWEKAFSPAFFDCERLLEVIPRFCLHGRLIHLQHPVSDADMGLDILGESGRARFFPQCRHEDPEGRDVVVPVPPQMFWVI